MGKLNNVNLQKHLKLAITYFFVVALMGIVLRALFVFPLPINYKFLLHAHSHLALLGWIYIALTTLIYKLFLPNNEKVKAYQRIFIFTNITIIGMTVTFPFQGYAFFSIIFSTLFLFASYFFCWFVTKNVSAEIKDRFSWRFIKASLFYLAFSSIGPWSLGLIMTTIGTDSIWYSNAIYFYLHFQYNGWFISALLGILFSILENNGVKFDLKKSNRFYLLFHFATILTLFLSFLWSKPPVLIYIVAFVGVIIQIVAFYHLYRLLEPVANVHTIFDSTSILLVRIASLMLLIKLVLQSLSFLPFFAPIAFEFRDFVIGYLHLVLLGIIAPTLFAFLHHYKLLRIPRFFLELYFGTFVITEILIFYKGIALWASLPIFSYYFFILLILSLGFPISIGLLLFRNFRK